MREKTSPTVFAFHFAFFILSVAFFFSLTGCFQRHRVAYEKRVPAEPVKTEVRKETPARETQTLGKMEKRTTREVQYGIASWYGPDFHGKPTSSGEIYDMYQLTCAHNSFPLGTVVMVTNLENGRSVELKVNDRGPFVKERLIDVSYAAAQILDLWVKGTAQVKVEGFGPLIDAHQPFTLQVGSFTEETKANRMADQLRQKFDDVYVATVETSTQRYYRVRIGRFDSKEPAREMAEQLSRMGFQVLVTNR
jgi:rare lipoprotein A